MIGKLKDMLSGLVDVPADQADELALDLAVAVLMVEMARADHQLDASEEQTIQAQLEKEFGMNAEQGAQLLTRARELVEDSVSLHEFTRTIHESMDYEEKQRVIEMLWRVALADYSLDKYEDYLIAKIGELLYMSRGDVMRLKHRVVQDIRPADD